tara:strand:+ start:250 stop:507 length:258 start_codon:yes stop_codon:yes gene_type:complete
MTQAIVSALGTTVEQWDGHEAAWNLPITIEEIKIVLMGLKKRLKKAKGKETQERFQTKIDRWELFLANIPETADAQVEITLEEEK